MSTHALSADPIVFVVDDDATARQAVAELVRSTGRRTEEFASATEFYRRLDDLPPTQIGCMVCDLRMHASDVLELQTRLVDSQATLPAIVTTTRPETATTVKMLRNGILAVLEKPFRENELSSFIEEALVESEEQQRRLLHRRSVEQRLKRLSSEERQVLQLLLEGCKNRTMANRLGVSLRTVENRRRRVFETMQAESVAELTRLVLQYEHNLVPSNAARDAWLALPFEPVA